MSVYFITCREMNTVKIGSSLEPHARLKEIQTGCPFQLTLEATLPGNHEEEHQYHQRFADERLKGEWFKITDLIELIIKNNPPLPAPEKSAGSSRRVVKDTWRQIEDRRHEQYAASIRRAQQRAINSRIASGDIHFPFRARESA